MTSLRNHPIDEVVSCRVSRMSELVDWGDGGAEDEEVGSEERAAREERVDTGLVMLRVTGVVVRLSGFRIPDHS